MAARATGSGSIIFGMVSVPVKLYTSAQPAQAIKFKQLSPEGGKLTQQYVNDTGAVVERGEMLKGYEVSKGRFVTFTQDEIKALDAESDNSIHVTEFVPLAEVNPIYFDKAYYLSPERGGERGYHLLAQAMRKTGLCAVARYAARGKQYLVLLRPADEGIVLQQLVYAHEVRQFSDIGVEPMDVSDAELDMAVQLVENLSRDDFKPSQYRDDVRDRIQGLIDAKIDGQEITVSEDESPTAQVVDLMEALKASLGADAALPDAPMQRTEGAEAKSEDKPKAKRKASKKKASSSKRRSA